MTVSIVGTPVQTTTNSGAATVGGIQGLTLATAPTAGDVVLLSYKSCRPSGARTVLSVTGISATWAALYSPPKGAFWLGTGTMTSGSMTLTQSAAGEAEVTMYVIRGLTANTVVGVTATSTGTSLTGTAQTATDGQIVVAMAVAMAGGLAYPSAQSPSGWTGLSINSSGNGIQVCDAYRIPSSSASHSTSLTATSGVNEISSIVLGDAVVANTWGMGRLPV